MQTYSIVPFHPCALYIEVDAGSITEPEIDYQVYGPETALRQF